MVKEKSKDGGNDVRQDWKDLEELKAFCDLCAVQILEGKRKGGFFRRVGVDAVIKQLGEMGKVVTHQQVKNKWDHLRKNWREYNKCFERDTVLGIDPGTFLLDASDEWWTRKIAACPKAGTFRKKVCQILTPWTSCLEARLQRGKMHSTQVVKCQRKAPKSLGTLLIAKNLLTPNVNPM